MSDMTQPRSARSLVTSGPFSRFWWAATIGSTGDWITVFAIIVLAANIGGSGGVLVAILARVLPGLLLGPVFGVFTDRFDRRTLIVVADVGRGVLVPLLAFVSSLPMLVGVTFLLEVLSLLGQAPRAAVVPRLVRPQNIVSANSLLLGATYGTIPLGAGFNWFLGSLPAITWNAIPLAAQDVALAFFVDSATFLVSGFIVATLPAIRTEAAEAAQAKGDRQAARDTLRDLGEGLRFFWQTRSVRRVIVAMTAALFGGGTVIVLGQPFVERVLRAGDTGFFAIVTMLGLGAAIGIAAVSLYSSRLLRRDLVFGIATVATGVGLAASAATQTVFGASAWMFVMGLGAGSAYVMGFSHLHEEVDDDLRGRVFATLFALMRIGLFVSMAVAVPIEVALGRASTPSWLFSEPDRTILFAGGVTILLSGVGVLWSLRSLFTRPKLAEDTRRFIEEANRARQTFYGRRPEDRE
ncbi:MAG: MFS transporter [Acidimicrobiia bacterium]|nr:MFS transporter [Acidimicrobiia bacterium]